MPSFPDSKQLSALTISKINALIREIEPDDSVIEILKADQRAGVRALAVKLERHRLREKNLRQKQENMLAIERELRINGKMLIAGVDEAGRGPLAGPVVAGAVILPEEVSLHGLDDSKKMTAKHREEMFSHITDQAIAWGIGMADNDEIDSTGILEATMKAMRTAVENLHSKPDIVLIDGNRAPGMPYDERVIVNGDALSLSIAAASVIAKVSRDRMMIDMDSMFPGYGFVRHKGYGAVTHIDAIRRLGPSEIHRFSFKIVPDVSPQGSVVSVLRKKLMNAPNREFLDRIAAGIARIREHLPASEINELREVYRKQRDMMKKGRKTTGAWGEDMSSDYLTRKGYSILDRNWRAERYGYEIDIVAKINKTIVFCEVKTAKTDRFGDPVSWVTPEKTQHVAKAADEYIAVNDLNGFSYRFDVIGIQVKGELHEIIHLENAFSVPEK